MTYDRQSTFNEGGLPSYHVIVGDDCFSDVDFDRLHVYRLLVSLEEDSDTAMWNDAAEVVRR